MYRKNVVWEDSPLCVIHTKGLLFKNQNQYFKNHMFPKTRYLTFDNKTHVFFCYHLLG